MLKSKQDGVTAAVRLLSQPSLGTQIAPSVDSSEHCKVVWTLYKSDILPFNLERHKMVDDSTWAVLHKVGFVLVGCLTLI